MNQEYLKKLLSATSAVILLAGCGGGGSSGSGNVVTVPPTPTPAPTPTPTPPPTTPVFTIGLTGPFIGEVIFDSNNSGIFGDTIASGNSAITDIRVDSNLVGQFGPMAVDRRDDSDVLLKADYAMRGVGIDVQSGYYYVYMRAPAGATVLSPATTLLRSIDDDAVAQNTGLGMTARELATFAAGPAMSSTDAGQAARGRKVAAFNLKLAAYAAIGAPLQEAVIPDVGLTFDGTLAAVIEQLKLGRVDLNDEAAIRLILERMPKTSDAASRQAIRPAAAALLARYAAAIDTYLTETKRTAAIEHGLRLIVLPALIDMINGGDPDAVNPGAITTDSLLAAFRDFSEIPAPTISSKGIYSTTTINSLIAVTDFRSIGRYAAGNTLVLRAGCEAGAGNNASPLCNDAAISGGIGVDHRILKVTAIRVPDKFADKFSASLAVDGEITLRRLNDSVGLVWFEYDMLEPAGMRATGRTYVRLGGAY